MLGANDRCSVVWDRSSQCVGFSCRWDGVSGGVQRLGWAPRALGILQFLRLHLETERLKPFESQNSRRNRSRTLRHAQQGRSRRSAHLKVRADGTAHGLCIRCAASVVVSAGHAVRLHACPRHAAVPVAGARLSLTRASLSLLVACIATTGHRRRRGPYARSFDEPPGPWKRPPTTVTGMTDSWR